MNLEKKNITNDKLKNLSICIIGLGYVGLPLAIEFSKKFKIIGYDKDKNRIKSLKKGNIVKEKDLVSLRPAEGIPSNFYFKILNKKLKKNITKFSKMSLKDFSL